MRPIGLTLKNAKLDKYSGRISGEIMIVHMCVACGAISCNRVAGDDNAYAILNLLNEIINSSILDRLNEKNIHMLSPEDEHIVGTALLGKHYKTYIE